MAGKLDDKETVDFKELLIDDYLDWNQ